VELPLFPLNTVLFPGMKLPLHIFEPRYRQMIGECIDEERPFGVVLIRSGPEVGGGAAPHEIGTTARLVEVERLDDGRFNIVCLGQDRFRIAETSSARAYLVGDVEILSDLDATGPAAEAAAGDVRERYLRFAQLTLAMRGEWALRVPSPSQPSQLADTLAARLPAATKTKQALLEELAVPHRLAGVASLLEAAVEVLRMRLAAVRIERYSGTAALN
jgi:Lon protease-like protein